MTFTGLALKEGLIKDVGLHSCDNFSNFKVDTRSEVCNINAFKSTYLIVSTLSKQFLWLVARTSIVMYRNDKCNLLLSIELIR